MNGRKAKLIRKFAEKMKVPYRHAKRVYKNLPRNKKAIFTEEFEKIS